jgi:DNA-binding response OmpR family regulator
MDQNETGILLWIPMSEIDARRQMTTLPAMAALLAEKVRNVSGIANIHAQITANRAPELAWKVGSSAIRIDGKTTYLTVKQTTLLSLLWAVGNAGLTFDLLPAHLRDDLASEQSFRVAIHRLRTALGAYGSMIRSARSHGYYIEKTDRIRITE